MKPAIKLLVLATVLGLGLLAVPRPASAGGRFHVSLGFPVYGVPVAPCPPWAYGAYYPPYPPPYPPYYYYPPYPPVVTFGYSSHFGYGHHGFDRRHSHWRHSHGRGGHWDRPSAHGYTLRGRR